MSDQSNVIIQVAGADGNPMYLSLPQGYLLSGSVTTGKLHFHGRNVPNCNSITK